MNSLVMYLLAAIGAKWIREALYAAVGQAVFETTYGPIVESVAVLSICWLICWILYRPANIRGECKAVVRRLAVSTCQRLAV